MNAVLENDIMIRKNKVRSKLSKMVLFQIPIAQNVRYTLK